MLISQTDELVRKLLKLLGTNSINENIYKHGKVNISSFLNKPLHKHLGKTPIHNSDHFLLEPYHDDRDPHITVKQHKNHWIMVVHVYISTISLGITFLNINEGVSALGQFHYLLLLEYSNLSFGVIVQKALPFCKPLLLLYMCQNQTSWHVSSVSISSLKMLNGGQIHIGIGMELLCAWAATLMVTSQQGRLKQTNKQANLMPCLQHTIASSTYRK